jgi:hypothetical protein
MFPKTKIAKLNKTKNVFTVIKITDLTSQLIEKTISPKNNKQNSDIPLN